MNVQIRNATLTDLSFVGALYSECVKGGHFASQPTVPIDKMLFNWLSTKSIARWAVTQDELQRSEVVPIKSLVAEVNGELAGFLITAPEGSEAISCIEIYMLAVSKAARRCGVATHLILQEEQQYSAETSFFARCYPKSSWAISIFKQLAYTLEKVSENTQVHYFRKASSAV
jgi:ribosomal protein S18 acetylase RimI-like enzyme